MKKNWTLLGLALGTLLATGCTREWVRGFSDHGSANLTILQSTKTQNWFVTRMVEYPVYVCQDKGDTLVCKRECGGKEQDLSCPKMSASMGGVSTNNTR